MMKITRFSTPPTWVNLGGGQRVQISFEAPDFVSAKEVGRNLFIERISGLEGCDDERTKAIKDFDEGLEKYDSMAAALKDFVASDHEPTQGGLYCRMRLDDDSGNSRVVAFEVATLAESTAATLAIDALQQYARDHGITFTIGKQAP